MFHLDRVTRVETDALHATTTSTRDENAQSVETTRQHFGKFITKYLEICIFVLRTYYKFFFHRSSRSLDYRVKGNHQGIPRLT